jgi:hypothetical protein
MLARREDDAGVDEDVDGVAVEKDERGEGDGVVAVAVAVE